MEKKKHIPFYVICDDSNKKEFEQYDVMPHFLSEYVKDKQNRRQKTPKTFEEFKKFVEDESLYQFWSRCEYEIVIGPWVSKTKEKKIDVHWQVMMNIDVVTKILMENVKKKLWDGE